MYQTAFRVAAAVLLAIQGTLGYAVSTPLKGFVEDETYSVSSKNFSLRLMDRHLASTLKDSIQDNGEQVTFSDGDGNEFSVMVVPTGEDLPADFIDGIIERSRKDGQSSEKGETPEGDVCLIQRQLLKMDGEKEGTGRMNLIFTRNKTIFDIVMVTKGYKESDEASDALDRGFVSFWKMAEFRGAQVEYPPLKTSIDPLVARALDETKKIGIEKGYGFGVSYKKKVVVEFSTRGNSEVKVFLGLDRWGPKVRFTQAVSCRGDDFELGNKTQSLIVRSLVKRLRENKIPYFEDPSMDVGILPSRDEMNTFMPSKATPSKKTGKER